MTRRNQAIRQFLLPAAALCATDRAQSPSGDADNFDIAGIRLDISAEQAQAALHAHDPSMKVQTIQSPSQLGKGTFTSDVVGLTGSQTGKSDAILISFTETESNSLIGFDPETPLRKTPARCLFKEYRTRRCSQ
jgi:hypothetical protein